MYWKHSSRETCGSRVRFQVGRVKDRIPGSIQPDAIGRVFGKRWSYFGIHLILIYGIGGLASCKVELALMESGVITRTGMQVKFWRFKNKSAHFVHRQMFGFGLQQSTILFIATKYKMKYFW